MWGGGGGGRWGRESSDRGLVRTVSGGFSDIRGICAWNRAYEKSAKIAGLPVHKVRFRKRDPHGYFVSSPE